MLKSILLVISVLALARAQIPNVGWCPDYVPMANFDIGKFMGNWFEVERSYQWGDLGSRCAMVSYTKGLDNKLHVSNIIGRLLGFQRVIEGEIILPSSKSEEGKLNLRYTTSLSNLPTNYHVLETDYKNYAVLWNCNGIGPLRAENLWIMSRSRLPSSETLQKAYAVLDKYKISQSYLARTDQTDCKYPGIDIPPLAESGSESTEESPVEETPNKLRTAIIHNDTEIDGDNQDINKSEKVKAAPAEKKLTVELNEKIEEDKVSLPSTVAEVILKSADSAKEQVQKLKSQIDEPTPCPASALKIKSIVAIDEPIKKPIDILKKEQQEKKKIEN